MFEDRISEDDLANERLADDGDTLADDSYEGEDGDVDGDGIATVDSRPQVQSAGTVLGKFLDRLDATLPKLKENALRAAAQDEIHDAEDWIRREFDAINIPVAPENEDAAFMRAIMCVPANKAMGPGFAVQTFIERLEAALPKVRDAHNRESVMAEIENAEKWLVEQFTTHGVLVPRKR